MGAIKCICCNAATRYIEHPAQWPSQDVFQERYCGKIPRLCISFNQTFFQFYFWSRHESSRATFTIFILFIFILANSHLYA